MLNGNEKSPKTGLPVPAVPLLVLLIWVVLWLVNDYVVNLPKWADLTVIGGSAVFFFAWCFGAFARKGQ